MSPPVEISVCRPGVYCLGGGMVHFAGYARLIVRDVVWCLSDTNPVNNCSKKLVLFSSPVCLGQLPVCSVQFRAWGPSASIQFIQFSS